MFEHKFFRGRVQVRRKYCPQGCAGCDKSTAVYWKVESLRALKLIIAQNVIGSLQRLLPQLQVDYPDIDDSAID
jgi:hypothetical protein